jgi:hypothetical protein
VPPAPWAPRSQELLLGLWARCPPLPAPRSCAPRSVELIMGKSFSCWYWVFSSEKGAGAHQKRRGELTGGTGHCSCGLELAQPRPQAQTMRIHTNSSCSKTHISKTHQTQYVNSVNQNSITNNYTRSIHLPLTYQTHMKHCVNPTNRTHTSTLTNTQHIRRPQNTYRTHSTQ